MNLESLSHKVENSEEETVSFAHMCITSAEKMLPHFVIQLISV